MTPASMPMNALTVIVMLIGVAETGGLTNCQTLFFVSVPLLISVTMTKELPLYTTLDTVAVLSARLMPTSRIVFAPLVATAFVRVKVVAPLVAFDAGVPFWVMAACRKPAKPNKAMQSTANLIRET
jgi:hypothetical protein